MLSMSGICYMGRYLLLPLGVCLMLAQSSVGQALAESDATATPGYRTPAYASGVQAYRLGDYENAVRYFQQALLIDWAHVNSRYYLALALDKLGLKTEAAREYAYVVSHGQDRQIVAYASDRLKVLQPNAPELAMMVAGSQMAPVVYRGAVSQMAVPLKANRNALMVDAVLSQGQSKTDGAFIIDTGATYTSISTELAEQLGLDLKNAETIYITTANGRIEVPKITIEELSVNGVVAHNVEATVIPVRKGSSFSGLLGLSFIRQFVLTIDPQANQLIFRKN